MNEEVMGEAVEKLLAYRHAEDCYTVPYEQVRDLQIEALNERLQERIDKIKLVRFRAEKANISEIRSLDDVVPLLLPHTAYKSYPESYLIEERWDKLTKWLGSVSTSPLDHVDLSGLGDVDSWIERLDAAGHPISCSSGTTGKSAMLIASAADNQWAAEDVVLGCSWGTGIKPEKDRRIFGLAPVAHVPRNTSISDQMVRGYGDPRLDHFHYPVPPITVGSITRMVALRKAVTEGTAMPAEIAEYEATTKVRQKAVEDAIDLTVDALLEAREEKLFLMGLWANVYNIAVAMLERGFSGKDFHPENMMYVGGGLKGAKVPDNYQDVIRETFNVSDRHVFHFYGMQELNSVSPRCSHGRYHVPPWVVCLPLNKEADALVCGDGEVQCRGGFFDLSIDGRWGGVISGDRLEVDFSPCACGARSPSIGDNVVRFVDLEGDDKIGCAGTVDAYVRGLG